jgi:SNF2 family DNA or RNA helicase
MSSQENETKFKGGILADEMGMGKTIQTIACMMKNRATGPDIGLPSKGQRTKSTLIICPQVAMVQWRGEIERYCAAGSMTLTMYHGPKRIADAGMLRLGFGVYPSRCTMAPIELQTRVCRVWGFGFGVWGLVV